MSVQRDIRGSKQEIAAPNLSAINSLVVTNRRDQVKTRPDKDGVEEVVTLVLVLD